MFSIFCTLFSNFFISIGARVSFILKTFKFSGCFYFGAFLQQFIKIFFFSLPLICMTAFFTGAVLALQCYIGFIRFNAENSIASIIVIAITRELGPVITALMIAGRVGASITAEISTMKVTNQIDALKMLCVNPFQYLFLPRILSSMIAMPLLVLIADLIGIFGGYIVSITTLHFNEYLYINNTLKFLNLLDVISGLTKAFFFGLAISVIGCYNGYYCRQDSQGVGLSTTKTLVQSSIIILIINYIITIIYFSK